MDAPVGRGILRAAGLRREKKISLSPSPHLTVIYFVLKQIIINLKFMNTSLKTLATLIALAVCTAVPFARAADTTAPTVAASTIAKPNKAIERLQAQLQPLNLTDDQKARVDAILQDEEKSAAALRKDKGVAKEERQTEKQELRQSTLEKIRAVLTPEQNAKFGKHAKGNGKVKAGGETADKADSASAL